MFYLSSRANLEDKEKVAAVLQKFKNVITETEREKNPEQWKHKATLIWAQMNLEFITRDEAQSAMQALLERPEINDKWKEKWVEDFERYKLIHGLGKDQVPILTTGTRFEQAFPSAEP